MPKYIVHVGPPKTGTKYLQSLLYHSRAALLAAGIEYPDDWRTREDQISHDPLYRLIKAGRHAEIAETFRRLNSSATRIVVLSCEGFSHLTPQEFGLLREWTGGNPVEFVYYCRRWSERIPSDWKQAVQMGHFPTLPEFYANYVRHAQFSGSVNYSLIWATICGVFGRGSLRLVSYSNLRDRNVDLFAHFAGTFLDWHEDAGVQAALVMDQESPGTFDIEIIRALNWIDYQAVGRHRQNMRIKYLQLRRTIDTRALEQLMSDDVGSLEISDGAEAFRLSWKEMHEYSDRLVSRDSKQDRLFEMRTVPAAYVRGNYLIRERPARELQRIWRYLDESVCESPGLS